MAQRPKKRIRTRWGYLSDGFSKLAATVGLLGSLLQAASDWFQWQLLPAHLLVVLSVILLFGSSLTNFLLVMQLRQAGVRWVTDKTGGESSWLWEFFPTLLATALSVTAFAALFSLVLVPASTIFFWMMTGPLMWLSLTFKWKHQREQRAIERTMNKLAQTLANVAGEKARRETAAQRGTNATIGGVSGRLSWAHWWTDAGTREEVTQKQENFRG